MLATAPHVESVGNARGMRGPTASSAGGSVAAPASEFLPAPAQVVGQQLAGSRERGRRPGWGGRGGRRSGPGGPRRRPRPRGRRRPHGAVSRTRPRFAGAGRAAATAPTAAGLDPAASGPVPGRPAVAGPGRRERPPGGRGCGRRGRSRKRRPTGASPAPPGSVQQLPEPRHRGQPWLDVPADRLDPEVTVAVEQAGAVQDGQPADLVGPAIVVPQQHEQIRRGQPLQQTCLRHHATLLPSQEVMVSAISCTKVAVASKATAWPAPSIRCILAVGMAAVSDRVKPSMLVGLRAP
jgi:hypothetical protein